MSGAASASTLTPLTVYRRDIAASPARIWENVLDWEHLPWLHRDAFLGVHLLEEWRDGWRAEISLPPQATPRSTEIAVRLERPALRYRTTTLSGFGTGTDIVTELAPRSAHMTAITVAFHVPGVEAARKDAVADAYTRLYQHLWDQDEAMMVRRQALLDGFREGDDAAGTTPSPLALGLEHDVRARLPLVVEFGGREVRLVDVAGEIVAHTTVCPHLGGPLDAGTVEEGRITCPWHGYRFDLRTGANLDGHPCRLAPAPRVTIDPETRHVTLTVARSAASRPG
jgi:nitrite reductase/ring-hydroxylating ferredoxin subunit